MSLVFLIVLLLVCSVQTQSTTEYPIDDQSTYAIQIVPHHVSIQYNGTHICSGAIVETDTVVTVAQCVDGLDLSNIQVRVGSQHRYRGGEIVKLREYHLHPLYNRRTNDYDVAVLFFSNFIKYSDFVQPVKIGKEIPIIELGSSATLSGWEMRSVEDGEQQNKDVLQVIDKILVVDNDVCEHKYNNFYITANMFCDDNINESSCGKDIGAPLVWEGELIGVLSWKFRCGILSRPGVYANIPRASAFIESEIDRQTNSILSRLDYEYFGAHFFPNRMLRAVGSTDQPLTYPFEMV